VLVQQEIRPRTAGDVLDVRHSQTLWDGM